MGSADSSRQALLRQSIRDCVREVSPGKVQIFRFIYSHRLHRGFRVALGLHLVLQTYPSTYA